MAKQNALIALHINAIGERVKETQDNTQQLDIVDFQAISTKQYMILSNPETNSFPSYWQRSVTHIDDNGNYL